MNNILLTENDQIENNIFSIRDKFRLDHFFNVLRLKIGDSVRLCYLNKGLANGIIKSLTQSEVIIQTEDFTEFQRPWVDLLVGLSRPPTCKKILEHATTLGTGNFHFFKAELSEKSYLQSKLFQDHQYQKLIELGLSQSGVYHQLPECKISPYNPLKEYEKHENKFILSLDTDKRFDQVKINFNQKILLALGPERGWTTAEINLFKDNGFQEISISSSILRVETAVFTSLGQLELLKRQQL